MRLAVPASVFALGALLFAAWMHPAVLDPANVGWLLAGDDRGQSAIGTAAYLRAGGPWPGLRQALLAAPEGLSLLFTDSIPLIGFALKPFARWLPPGVQFIGAWYLLCTLLQAGFAWALLRRRTADPVVAWLGAALLAAMPALFNRYGHGSLCAQWLILWALWVFVDERRSRATWWWPAVLGTAAMVHSYLLLMVAAIWGSAFLADLVRGGKRPRLLARAALALGVTTLIVSAHGVFDGPFASTRSYGSWPVALDAWWNPQNPHYTALLPSSPDRRAIGFEGLQYLGAGLLFAVVAAAVIALRGGVAAAVRPTLKRLAWLLPALVVLAVVAIGPEPLWRGRPLFVIDLPLRVVDALDPVRAAGRLVWPATYALAFAALIVLASHRRALLLLSAALALQVVDLAPMLRAIRATSARAADPLTFARTRDPRWPALVAGAGAIDFQPPDPYADLQFMEEVTWRAVLACRPVRFTYASRQTKGVRDRLARDAAAFRRGRIDPGTLYVLLDRRVPAPLADRVEWIDGIPVIPAGIPPPATTRC